MKNNQISSNYWTMSWSSLETKYNDLKAIHITAEEKLKFTKQLRDECGIKLESLAKLKDKLKAIQGGLRSNKVSKDTKESSSETAAAVLQQMKDLVEDLKAEASLQNIPVEGLFKHYEFLVEESRIAYNKAKSVYVTCKHVYESRKAEEMAKIAAEKAREEGLSSMLSILEGDIESLFSMTEALEVPEQELPNTHGDTVVVPTVETSAPAKGKKGSKKA